MKPGREPASSRPKLCASLKKPHESCLFAAPCGPRNKKNDRGEMRDRCDLGVGGIGSLAGGGLSNSLSIERPFFFWHVLCVIPFFLSFLF